MSADTGMLQKIERNIAKIVDSVFTKAFPSRIQSTEIASALKQKMDSMTQGMDPGKIVVPNRYVVELHPRRGDYILSRAHQLSRELAAFAAQHAADQGYKYPDEIDVSIAPNDKLSRGCKISATSPLIVWRAFLVINNKKHPIGAGAVIGRGPEADIQLEDPGISRQHARINIAGDEVEIVDAGSTNGFTVNGKKCKRAVLKNNSLISLGKQKALFVLLPVLDSQG